MKPTSILRVARRTEVGAGGPQHEDGDHDQKRHEEYSDGGTLAEVGTQHAALEGERGQDLCGIRRAPARQDVDDAEIGGGVDDPEQHSDSDDRKQERELDPEEPSPEARAVHDGCLDDVLRNRRESREHDHRGERENTPRLHDDDRAERETRLSEPVQPAVEQPGHPERPVDHAERRVKDPGPRDRGERDGHGPWQQQHEPGEAFAAEGGPEYLRGGRREHDDEHLRSDRHDRGIAERAKKDRIGQNGCVVVKPGPVERQASRGCAREAEQNGEHERDAHEEDHVREGRAEHRRAEQIFAIGELHRRTRAPVSASK